MRKILTAFAATILLSACGSSDEATQVAETTDATATATATATAGEDAVAIATSDGADGLTLPDGFTIYPGAEVITSTTLTSSDPADGSGVVVIMHSADAPAKLIAHYRGQAEAAGIVIAEEGSFNGSDVLRGDGPGGSTFSFNASPDDAGSIAQLVVGRDPG